MPIKITRSAELKKKIIIQTTTYT